MNGVENDRPYILRGPSTRASSQIGGSGGTAKTHNSHYVKFLQDLPGAALAQRYYVKFWRSGPPTLPQNRPHFLSIYNTCPYSTLTLTEPVL